MEEEKIYRTGFKLYDQGQYKEASSLFMKLVLQDPLEECYWRGLAASRQMERKYESALHAWGVVALLARQDALAHFHAAECLFALSDLKDGKKALNLAEERLKSHDPLFEKIQRLRDFYATAD